jgi:hypothetical protein
VRVDEDVFVDNLTMSSQVHLVSCDNFCLAVSLLLRLA